MLEVYSLLAPPPSSRLRPGQQQPSLLSMVILIVFGLFIFTISQPIVSAAFIDFVCPKCFTMYANQPMMKYKVSYIVQSILQFQVALQEITK